MAKDFQCKEREETSKATDICVIFFFRHLPSEIAFLGFQSKGVGKQLF